MKDAMTREVRGGEYTSVIDHVGASARASIPFARAGRGERHGAEVAGKRGHVEATAMHGRPSLLLLRRRRGDVVAGRPVAVAGWCAEA
jgi:hypothetical protein